MLWPFSHRGLLALTICWSYGLAMCVALGQDTPFTMLFLVGGIVLLERRQDVAAGLVLSLAMNKFHLAACVPVLLIALRRWRALGSGAVGCGALVAVSFVIEPNWTQQLAGLSGRSDFSPAPYKMPNVHGLAYWFPASIYVEIVLTAAIMAAVYVIARAGEWRRATAVGLTAGLLTSFHSYAYDTVLLLPLITLVLGADDSPRVAKIWAIFVSVPAVYLLMMHPATGMAAQFLLAGGCLAVIADIAVRALRRGDQALVE
jgi:hypothetical protein